jgi:hypothetical protein
MEVASQTSPTCRLTQTPRIIGFLLVKLGLTFLGVRLHNTAGIDQMARDMLFLPVWYEPIDSIRRC